MLTFLKYGVKVVNNFFMGLEIWFEVKGWGSPFLKLQSVRDS